MEHLIDMGVEYCVLRATWFMGALLPHTQTCIRKLLANRKGVENFSEWQRLTTIRDKGKINTACADRKILFVSATDIAAFQALTDAEPHSTTT